MEYLEGIRERARSTVPEASARFGRTQGIVLPLEVDSPDGRAMIRELSEALFELRVQIVAVTETGSHAGIRFDVCEFHGGPLSPRRQKLIVDSLATVIAGPPRAA